MDSAHPVDHYLDPDSSFDEWETTSLQDISSDDEAIIHTPSESDSAPAFSEEEEVDENISAIASHTALHDQLSAKEKEIQKLKRDAKGADAVGACLLLLALLLGLGWWQPGSASSSPSLARIAGNATTATTTVTILPERTVLFHTITETATIERTVTVTVTVTAEPSRISSTSVTGPTLIASSTVTPIAQPTEATLHHADKEASKSTDRSCISGLARAIFNPLLRHLPTREARLAKQRAVHACERARHEAIIALQIQADAEDRCVQMDECIMVGGEMAFYRDLRRLDWCRQIPWGRLSSWDPQGAMEAKTKKENVKNEKPVDETSKGVQSALCSILHRNKTQPSGGDKTSPSHEEEFHSTITTSSDNLHPTTPAYMASASAPTSSAMTSASEEDLSPITRNLLKIIERAFDRAMNEGEAALGGSRARARPRA